MRLSAIKRIADDLPNAMRVAAPRGNTTTQLAKSQSNRNGVGRGSRHHLASGRSVGAGKSLGRLDRVPVHRRILLLVGLLGVIWILEAFDIGIIAPVLFILKNEWRLSPSSTGLIGSAGTVGIVLGLLPAGRMADRFGRKKTARTRPIQGWPSMSLMR